MRKHLFTAFMALLFLSGTHYSNARQANEEESIYVQALRKYIEWIKRFEPDTQVLYFEELKGVTSTFPKSLEDIEIRILNGRNQLSTYQANNNLLVQRKMGPAKVKGKQIEIGITPYQGRLDQERGIRLSFSKWHAVIFEYNPKAERFEYARFENR